jgi:hypothetical protein
METYVFGWNNTAGVTSYGLLSNDNDNASSSLSSYDILRPTTNVRLRHITIHFPDPEADLDVANVEANVLKNCGKPDTFWLGRKTGFNNKLRKLPPRSDNGTGWVIQQ